MGGNGHVKTPCGLDERLAETQEGRTFKGAAFSKTVLIYSFSVVVGHGATHHRRSSDDGKWRGIGSE
jgi:hypothetical protein